MILQMNGGVLLELRLEFSEVPEPIPGFSYTHEGRGYKAILVNLLWIDGRKVWSCVLKPVQS